MEVEGIIVNVGELRTGVSNQGNPWRMQDYLLETVEQYPKKYPFTVSDGRDGRITRLNIQQGKKYKVFFDIDSHEYQGRWFVTLRAWDAREIQ